MRQIPEHAAATRVDTSATGTSAMPATCATRHQRNRQEVQREAGERHARKHERADRQQRCSSVGALRQPSIGRPRARARGRHCCQPRIRGSDDQESPSVAPKVRTKAGSSTDSGCVGDEARRHQRQRVERRTALIDRAGREVHHGHQRRAIDRRAAADQPPYAISTAIAASIAVAAQHAGEAERAEHQAGENRDVAAGDRDHVIRARLLQPPLHLVVQAGAIADDDGGDDGRRSRGSMRPTAAAIARRANGANARPTPSSSQEPRATSSTSAPLFTVPTSVVPRRASARSSSGTPGSR